MRIGVFCGCFSPVHLGHTTAADAFMRQMWLDYLIVLPLENAPVDKRQKCPTRAERIDMCKLAFRDYEGVMISDFRAGFPKTPDAVTFLEYLRDINPADTRIFLLMGCDEVLLLPSNPRSPLLFQLCYPCYVRRRDSYPDDGEKRLLSALTHCEKSFGKMCRRIVVPPVPVCSGNIREAVMRGQSIDGTVSPIVSDYIREHGLYLPE